MHCLSLASGVLHPPYPCSCAVHVWTSGSDSVGRSLCSSRVSQAGSSAVFRVAHLQPRGAVLPHKGSRAVGFACVRADALQKGWLLGTDRAKTSNGVPPAQWGVLSTST
jgi:hypothetical protein